MGYYSNALTETIVRLYAVNNEKVNIKFGIRICVFLNPIWTTNLCMAICSLSFACIGDMYSLLFTYTTKKKQFIRFQRSNTRHKFNSYRVFRSFNARKRSNLPFSFNNK